MSGMSAGYFRSRDSESHLDNAATAHEKGILVTIVARHSGATRAVLSQLSHGANGTKTLRTQVAPGKIVGIMAAVRR